MSLLATRVNSEPAGARRRGRTAARLSVVCCASSLVRLFCTHCTCTFHVRAGRNYHPRTLCKLFSDDCARRSGSPCTACKSCALDCAYKCLAPHTPCTYAGGGRARTSVCHRRGNTCAPRASVCRGAGGSTSCAAQEGSTCAAQLVEPQLSQH